MEIAIGICLGLVAFGFLVAMGKAMPPTEDEAREEFFRVNGRYPTEADFEDPIA